MNVSKTKHYCSVPQCNNYKNEGISLHNFPKDRNLCRKWAIALRIGKPVTPGMQVCSEHFAETDFFPATDYNKKRFLKRNVIPSKKIPKRSHDPDSSGCTRTKRSKETSVERDQTQDPVPSTSAATAISENEEEQLARDQMEIQYQPRTADTGTQVNTLSETNRQLNFHQYILSSSFKTGIYCGISVQVFEAIVKAVINTLKAFPQINQSNIEKKICIVLTKLKLDLSFRALSVMYEVSTTTVQNYFYEMIQILHIALKCAIYFPSKEDNMRNIPTCFRNYSNVRIVLDATEVPIQKSKCLNCRIRTYSHYKKTHTAKFLISVAPAGLIAHVSAAYGGRVSDKAIFNEERIIDLLDSHHDAIMVDKGVLIENECREQAITLIRPPFLRKKKQFSKEEAIQTASIARARVHVERSIQRIKIFKILHNKLEWSLVPYLTEIMTVVCALVNLSNPILSDQRF